MWFKTITLFKLQQPITYDADTLGQSLANFKFSPCPASFSYSHGFISPVTQEDESPLVHAANGYMMLCLQSEEKILPGSVVRDALNEKIAEIEKEEHRRVSRKEKQDLKEELTLTLLPKAFSRKNKIYAYVDTHRQWLVLNTTSKRKIEKFLTLFHKACPGYPLTSPYKESISKELTQYLEHQPPEKFYIEQKCTFKDPDQSTRSIRLQAQDLSSSFVKEILSDQYQAFELRLNWQGRISFTLKDDFSINQIKYDTALIADAKSQYTETAAERFDADFFIMTENLSQFFQDLLPKKA